MKDHVGPPSHNSYATIIRFVGWSGKVRAPYGPFVCRRKKCDFGSRRHRIIFSYHIRRHTTNSS
eukprot:scaffold277628_cov31-Attheya_sp.AAC.1